MDEKRAVPIFDLPAPLPDQVGYRIYSGRRAIETATPTYEFDLDMNLVEPAQPEQR